MDISCKLNGTSVRSVIVFVASMLVNTSISHNKIDLSQLDILKIKFTYC